jgi:hypothetical protein
MLTPNHQKHSSLFQPRRKKVNSLVHLVPHPASNFVDPVVVAIPEEVVVGHQPGKDWIGVRMEQQVL